MTSNPTAAGWFVVAGSVRGERGLGAVDARSTRPAASLGQSVAARPCGPAAGALRALSASPARPRRSPRLPPLPIAIDGGGLGPDHGQEGVGQQRQGDVPIPGGPAADLVVVQADFAFGLLEGLLDRPADPGDPGPGPPAASTPAQSRRRRPDLWDRRSSGGQAARSRRCWASRSELAARGSSHPSACPWVPVRH